MFGRLLALAAASALFACESRALESRDEDATSDSSVCALGKRVLTRDVLNARDLGGMPLLTGESTACGELFRGPPLAGLSATGCEHVAALGIRTVIDLRMPDESSSHPESSCIAEGLAVVPAPLPIPYDVSVADYIADLDETESIATVFATLGDGAAYPIYFHCTYGRDRTGILAALVYWVLGAEREDIVKEYNLSANLVGAYPGSLRGALAAIDDRGGIDAYLAEVGVSEAELAALRAHAVGVKESR